MGRQNQWDEIVAETTKLEEKAALQKKYKEEIAPFLSEEDADRWFDLEIQKRKLKRKAWN